MWLFFSVFSFLEFLNLPGSFLNWWKKLFPMQQNSFQLHCCAKELSITLFFPSQCLLHILSFLCFDPNGAPSLAVWDSSCADPGMFFVGCLYYRRPFLHVSGKGLKALSAADIPGYHFDVRPLSWEIRQHKERKLYPLQRSCICCLCLPVFILSVKQIQSCLIGSLFGFCSE